MPSSIEHVVNETDPGKMGIIVSIVVMVGSGIPSFQSQWITIENPFRIQFFLIGLSLFFFAYAIKLNVRHKIEIINNEQYLATILPHNFNPLSKACFVISAVIFVISLISLYYAAV